MSWVIGLLTVIGGLVVLFLLKSLRTKEITSRFGNRRKLTSAEIWDAYYSTSDLKKTAVAEIWGEVAETLNVPAEIMRPKDKLTDYRVSSDGILTPDLDLLSKKAVARISRLDMNVKIETIITVDDYVRTFASSALLAPKSRD